MKNHLRILALLTLATVADAQVEPISHRQRANGQHGRTPALQTRRQAAPAQEPRPMIGVRMAPLDDSLAAQLPEHLQPAIVLTTIFEGSPAERAGLMVHDVVTAVDGEGNVTVDSFGQAIRSKQPGETVTLDVSRAGRNQVVNVTVDDYTPPARKRHSVSGMDQWKDYLGNQRWPRFGLSPDGQVMMQHHENGEWLASNDVSKKLKGALGRLHRDNLRLGESPVLDLTKPEADPDGTLRRHLDALRQLHQAKPGQVRESKDLEARIDALEDKVDDIHRMLEELLKRTK